MSCGEVNTLSLIFYAFLSKAILPSSQEKDCNDLTRKQGKVKIVCYNNFANLLEYMGHSFLKEE